MSVGWFVFGCVILWCILVFVVVRLISTGKQADTLKMNSRMDEEKEE